MVRSHDEITWCRHTSHNYYHLFHILFLIQYSLLYCYYSYHHPLARRAPVPPIQLSSHNQWFYIALSMINNCWSWSMAEHCLDHNQHNMVPLQLNYQQHVHQQLHWIIFLSLVPKTPFSKVTPNIPRFVRVVLHKWVLNCDLQFLHSNYIYLATYSL